MTLVVIITISVPVPETVLEVANELLEESLTLSDLSDGARCECRLVGWVLAVGVGVVLGEHILVLGRHTHQHMSEVCAVRSLHTVETDLGLALHTQEEQRSGLVCWAVERQSGNSRGRTRRWERCGPAAVDLFDEVEEEVRMDDHLISGDRHCGEGVVATERTRLLARAAGATETVAAEEDDGSGGLAASRGVARETDGTADDGVETGVVGGGGICHGCVVVAGGSESAE